MASLVLGIANFMILPLIGAILAIVLGKSARKEIAASPDMAGSGLATAGVVLGGIGLTVGLLSIVLFGMIAMAAFLSGS